MNPHPHMNAHQALEHQLRLAKKSRLDRALVDGRTSHSPKWHAFSILDHVRCVTCIAEQLVAAGAIHSDLITAALWHDVGKFISVQFGLDTPTFHNHAEVGANYLSRFATFPPHVLESIRFHGILRLDHEPRRRVQTDWLLPWLELCDEFGKWSESDFPPEGSAKTRRRRRELLRVIVSYGVPPFWVSFAEQILWRKILQ